MPVPISIRRKGSVPHPCAFFMARVWETKNLKVKIARLEIESSPSLLPRSVALLIFLSAAAEAGIVAAYFVAGPALRWLA